MAADDIKALIAEARKAADEIHRWAFGADDEIPDGDRHEVRLRVEAITDALNALAAAVRVSSGVAKQSSDREALIAGLRRDAGDYAKVAQNIPMSHELSWDARNVRAWEAAEALSQPVRVEAIADALSRHENGGTQ